MLQPIVGEEDQSSDRRQQSLFGFKVCQQAFRALLGIGSERWRRLKKCAQTGQKAPLDRRSLPRENLHGIRKQSENRELVVEYLQEIYESLSEPMPEARGKVVGEKKMAFRRNRGKRPRLAARLHRVKKSVEVKESESEPMRLLPPGTFTDYLTLLRCRYPEKKLSLKLFTADIWIGFSNIIMFSREMPPL